MPVSKKISSSTLSTTPPATSHATSSKRSSGSFIHDIPLLLRSFMSSVIDHSCNDTKVPYPVVKTRYETWKGALSEENIKKETSQEKYIIDHANPRTEYEQEYNDWKLQHTSKLEELKTATLLADQQRVMSELLQITRPREKTSAMDVYTRHIPRPRSVAQTAGS